jgi:fermentation-respiration switch protein FrsA (DUF1100 family)
MRAYMHLARISRLAILALVLLTACSNAAVSAGSTNQGVVAAPLESVTPQPPTHTSTPTSTYTPAPTSTPLPHPLSIDHLRDREFPASEIQIEETLANGANYHRYIASYRSDGLKIFALLTVPFGESPETGWPVVVFNHGYISPDQYRTTERYVAYVDGFARSGYIVFRSDYRGHDNSEGVARSAYGAPDYTIDVLNAVAAIKGFEGADPNRIGMWGHSMGGFITLRSMVTEEDIRAGVIWAGVVVSYADLFQRWSRGGATPGPTRTPRPGSWRNTLMEIHGTPEENPKFWDPLSANSYLDEISGPVQLHHGAADASVPLEFSQILYQQIEAVGGVAELYEYPGDNHNLSNYFTLAMQRSIDFFDRYVKNAEG